MASTEKSTERVDRFRERQRRSGRKLVTLYLKPETIAVLKALAKGNPRGEIVETAISKLLRTPE